MPVLYIGCMVPKGLNQLRGIFNTKGYEMDASDGSTVLTVRILQEL